MHNGFAPVGPASPNFRHGRHSILLKEIRGLGAHYERALADPDLLRLDGEIALIDARIGDLLEQSQGKRVDGIWGDLSELIEARRKLVDTEGKRLKDLHAMVSVDRVMTLVAYTIDTVRRHVTDREALTHIVHDLRKLLKPAEDAA